MRGKGSSFMQDLSKLFWRLQIAGWLLYSLSMIPSRLAIHPNFDFVLTVMLVKDGFGFLATLGLREIYRRTWLKDLGPMGLAPWLIGFSIALGAMDMIGGYYLYRGMGVGAPSIATGTYLVFGIWARTALYSVWSLLYFAIKLTVISRMRHMELMRAEARRQDAETLMLRSQLSPHFLFNVLNTMVSFSEHPTVMAMIENLSEYLRYSLAHRQGMLVKLGAELDALDSFLKLQKFRFVESLEFKIDVDDRVRDFMVPGIFIQPLVENAIKYGRATHRTGPILVTVKCGLEGEHLFIEVHNTGRWRNPITADILRPSGAGLDIVRRSLQLYYGDAQSFQIGETETEVVARIVLKGPSVFSK